MIQGSGPFVGPTDYGVGSSEVFVRMGRRPTLFQGHHPSFSYGGTRIVKKSVEKNLEGDVVLIYHQEKPSVYARIEAIEPDVKKDWYQVTLLMLTIPAQNVTWILREEYFQGAPFTMGGQPLRIEGVKRAPRAVPASDKEETPEKKPGPQASAKVIPLNRPKP